MRSNTGGRRLSLVQIMIPVLPKVLNGADVRGLSRLFKLNSERFPNGPWMGGHNYVSFSPQCRSKIGGLLD